MNETIFLDHFYERISLLNDNNDFVKRSYYWGIRKCLKKQEIRKYMRKYLKELFRKEYKIKLIIRLENDEFFFHFISNISTLLTNEM